MKVSRNVRHRQVSAILHVNFHRHCSKYDKSRKKRESHLILKKANSFERLNPWITYSTRIRRAFWMGENATWSELVCDYKGFLSMKRSGIKPGRRNGQPGEPQVTPPPVRVSQHSSIPSLFSEPKWGLRISRECWEDSMISPLELKAATSSS